MKSKMILSKRAKNELSDKQVGIKGIALVVIFLLMISVAFSQTEKQDLLNPEILWGEGSILLNDGRELKGLVRYNDKDNVLSYQNGNNSASYMARNVIGFEFFDEQKGKQRVFYSFPYQDNEDNVVRPQLFEALREFKGFALLSKIDRLKVTEKNREYSRNQVLDANGTPVWFNGNKVIISQKEVIYFMSESGEIKPYLEVTNKEIDKAIFDRSVTKEKKLDRDEIVKKLTGVHYEELKKYAHENDLDFKSKEGLLKILDYYGELIE
jgi:hypothetical protein